MPPHDRVASSTEGWVILPCLGITGQRPRLLAVRDKGANPDATWSVPTGADLVQRFLHGALQGLTGEAEEVEGDVLGPERPLDVGAKSDRLLGALSHEHTTASA